MRLPPPQAPRAQGSAPLDLASYPRTELTVTQGKPARVHNFRVWVADTPQRAEQGLMFVNDLPESEGMVFPLEPPRVENMWMKNTYIELDMLFIGTGGRVTKIIETAPPLSLETHQLRAAGGRGAGTQGWRGCTPRPQGR